MNTTATIEPTVVLVYTYPTTSMPGRPSRSYMAFDEGGEVIETVETNADGQPDWQDGGICDHRGLGGNDGFKALHAALTAAEANAKAVGLDIVRLPA